MPPVCQAGIYSVKWTVLLSLVSAIAPSSLIFLISQPTPAAAQIVPDGTLGSERSIVSPKNNVRGLPGVLIEGGARRGANLFQSFSDFNVGAGQRVYFANPAGVQSILSRVTGQNPSQILGTLGVDGAANLFLLNPRGILFGANARLDVAGSFVASTSDRFDFGNGLSYSATNPQAPPMLTVSLRPGLQYGTNYQGNLSSAGDLAVGAGQTLALAGKSVTITGSLSTPGGTVQVLGDRVALLDNARINVSGVNGGNVFIGGDFQGRGALPNATETLIAPNVTINADGIDAVAPANGGRVIVWADGTTRFGGTISAKGSPTGGDGGFVEVSGKQNLIYNGRVDASAINGTPGTLLLDPTNIEIVASGGEPGSLDQLLSTPGSSDLKVANTTVTRINADLINNSQTNVILQATNNITFSAPIGILASGIDLTATAGNSIFVNSDIRTNQGAVNLTAQAGDVIVNGVTIDTNRLFVGVAGNITISAAQQLSITNGGFLDARSNSEGLKFATIRLTSTEGSVSFANSRASATNIDTGSAGDIFIDAAEQIDIFNSRIASQGNYGRILLGVSNENELFNWKTTSLPASIRINNSLLSTENNGNVNLGRISVFARDQIDVSAGSELTSRSNNNENADSNEFSFVEVYARNGSISIDKSTISATNRGTGFAGDVVISAPDELSMRDSDIFSRGNQGRVLIGRSNTFENVADKDYPGFSPKSIQINNSTVNINNGAIEGNAAGEFDALKVSVRSAGSIEILNGSEISSSTERKGDAGTVTVEAPGRITLNDSRIFSNVERGGNGEAGLVEVSANSLYILNGGQIQSLVRGPSAGEPVAGKGNAGDVVITAPETVRVIGRNAEGFPSAIFTSVQEGATGKGGDVTITTRSLHVRNRAKIDANNFGAGEAGNIFIFARGVWVDNRAFITAVSKDGQGGNIFLNVPGAIILGRNGNITTSTVEASTQFGERAGNIAIGSGNPLVELIPAGGVAFGFDDRVLLLASKTARDNNIYSVGILANGGFIRVNAFRLQDIARRNDSPNTNDITAESIFGVSGEVVVSTVNVFPSFRVDPLPDRYEPPRVSEGCDPRIRQETSQFIVTGRGGLPSDPTEVLSPDALALPSSQFLNSKSPDQTNTAQTIVKPAQGWVKDGNGNVRLVAQATGSETPVNPYPFWSTPSSCYAP